MNITVRSLKKNAALSDETLCFSAIVCVDGKDAFQVSNRGNGGCHQYTPIGKNPEEIRRSRQLIKDAEQFALIKTHGAFEAFDELIDEIIDKMEIEKYIKSKTRNRILMIEDGQLMSASVKKGHTITPLIIQMVKNHHPNAVILNDMPLEQAAALVYSI